MTDNLFDKFFKDKLKDHSSPVPGDMWKKIQPQNGTERRGAFWWKSAGLIFLLLAVIVAGGIVFCNNQSNDNSPITEAKGSAEMDPSKIKETAKLNTKPKETKDAEPGLSTLTDKPPNSSTGTFPTHNISSQDDILIAGYKNSLPGFSSNNFIQQGQAKRNKTSVDLINLQGAFENSGTENDQTLFDFNKNHQSILASVAKEEKNLNNQLSPELLKQLNKFTPSAINMVDCPTAKDRRISDWYFEAFASPDYANKTIIKGSGVSDEFLKRKDSSESFKSAFTAGFRISKTIGEKMLIKTGAQYSQINEKFKYRTESERRLITVVVIRTIIRSPGDTVRVSDTSVVEQIGYRVKTNSNKYRSIDVPLILSYEWGGERFKVSTNAGVILNLHSWQSGEMLDTTYTPVAFNKTSTSQIFKQNIGMGLYASVSLLKRVSDNMEIFAEPYFRYNLSNMTKEKSPFTQKFNVAGINLGIRYKLSH